MGPNDPGSSTPHGPARSSGLVHQALACLPGSSDAASSGGHATASEADRSAFLRSESTRGLSAEDQRGAREEGRLRSCLPLSASPLELIALSLSSLPPAQGFPPITHPPTHHTSPISLFLPLSSIAMSPTVFTKTFDSHFFKGDVSVSVSSQPYAHDPVVPPSREANRSVSSSASRLVSSSEDSSSTLSLERPSSTSHRNTLFSQADIELDASSLTCCLPRAVADPHATIFCLPSSIDPTNGKVITSVAEGDVAGTSSAMPVCTNGRKGGLSLSGLLYPRVRGGRGGKRPGPVSLNREPRRPGLSAFPA